jgi:predicted KAP-like P-loop ATPase
MQFFGKYSSMRIVAPSLVVEGTDAFENDCLDRKKYGEQLRDLVLQTDDELVIALSGQWGEGKTTFVKMWQGLLAESKIPSIYIDAFANDYIDDAFISVASAITGFVSENIEKDSAEKLSDLKEKTKKVGAQILSWSAKIGIKAATLGIIREADIEELKDIKADLSKDMSNLIGGFIEERLESHSKDIELIQSFRELLSDMPSRLEGNEGNPLVIIIDELDRCRGDKGS